MAFALWLLGAYRIPFVFFGLLILFNRLFICEFEGARNICEYISQIKLGVLQFSDSLIRSKFQFGWYDYVDHQ